MMLASILDYISVLDIILWILVFFYLFYVLPGLLLLGLRTIGRCRNIKFLHCFVLTVICYVLIFVALGSPASETYEASASSYVMSLVFILAVIGVMSFLIKSFYNLTFVRTVFSWLFTFLGLIVFQVVIAMFVVPQLQQEFIEQSKGCESNLITIRKALDEYQQTFGATPETLMDLTKCQGFEKDTLQCPGDESGEKESYFLMYPTSSTASPAAALVVCEMTPNHSRKFACMTLDGKTHLLSKSELKKLLARPENETFAREFDIARAGNAR